MTNSKVDVKEKHTEMEIVEDGMGHATRNSQADFCQKQREAEESDWIAKLLKPYVLICCLFSQNISLFFIHNL